MVAGDEQSQVGYLIPDTESGAHAAVCLDCGELGDTPLFYINIYPYRQDCAKCGEEMVKGGPGDWPQLFTGSAESKEGE